MLCTTCACNRQSLGESEFRCSLFRNPPPTLPDACSQYRLSARGVVEYTDRLRKVLEGE